MESNYHKRFDRSSFIRLILVAAGIVLIGRLFYIQIVRHDYYQAKALAEHIKKFEISAPRGLIKIADGAITAPIVLNEKRYTIYADPAYIEDAAKTADKLYPVMGGNYGEIKKKLSDKHSRYTILAKKFTKDQADRIKNLNLKGIGTQEISIRTYPQGSLAAHLLGFVNDDGKGQYGVEQYLNSKLAGQTGLEKAVTDVRGIPLAINNDNILKQARAGKDVVLTIDMSMQKIAEDAIKSNLERTKAVKATAIIMESSTGNIKAMASYPNYNPGQFDKVSDVSLFINPSVSMPWEPGSVMKPLLISGAFTEGTANPDSSFYDPGYVQVGDRVIKDSMNWGAQTISVRDVIYKSLNTGAVMIFKTLGGGTINSRARNIWYDYLTKHYFFGQNTGIQVSGEASGYIAGPNDGDGLDVRYANMAFGQGLTVTPIQMVAAYNSIINGGTYFKPNLVSKIIDGNDVTEVKPEALARNVISNQAGKNIRQILKDSLEMNNKVAVRPGYALGAKSGTAQIADAKGNYRTDAYNGVYVGYLSGADRQYIILVRLDEPQTSASGFASGEAARAWADITNKMIDNLAIKPQS